ncbi:hypothetical protein [Microbulbifer epialgicus]|uniref:Uncharacterized protein n=1 Tax=Microbulbifer epialgicus TaxID=393907 RepID=A0ABV4P2U5_9GAMM
MNSQHSAREYVLIFSSALALVPAWLVGVVDIEIWVLLRAVLVFLALLLGLKIYALLGVYELNEKPMKYGFLISGFASIVLFQFLKNGLAGFTGRELFIAISFVPLIVLVLTQKIIFTHSANSD